MGKEIAKALSLLTQIGISMLVPIVICFFIGSFIDKLFDTAPVFMIIFVLLGIGGGFRSVYMLTRDFYEGKDKKTRI